MYRHTLFLLLTPFSDACLNSVYEESGIQQDACLEANIVSVKRLPNARDTFKVTLMDVSEKSIVWLAHDSFIKFLRRYPEILPLGVFSCDHCSAGCFSQCHCFEVTKEPFLVKLQQGHGLGTTKVEEKCTHDHLVSKVSQAFE